MMESALCLPTSKGSWKRNFPPSHPPFQITEVWLNRVSIHHRYNSHFIIPFILFSAWYEHECKSIDSKVKRQRNINGLKWGSFQVISPPNLVRCHSMRDFPSTATLESMIIVQNIIERFQKLNWKHFLSVYCKYFVSLKKKFMKVLWQEDKLWNCKNREINGFWRLTNRANDENIQF